MFQIFNRLKLWNRFKLFIGNLRESNNTALNLGYRELALNSVVIDDLRQRLKIDETELVRLLLLDKDKKDIIKARICGRIEMLTEILFNAYQAEKNIKINKEEETK